LVRRGQFAAAIPVLEKALEIEPEHLYAQQFLDVARAQVVP
jgi:hypothetical protein